MNEDFNKNGSPARKPIRRASRNVAPFSDTGIPVHDNREKAVCSAVNKTPSLEDSLPKGKEMTKEDDSIFDLLQTKQQTETPVALDPETVENLLKAPEETETQPVDAAEASPAEQVATEPEDEKQEESVPLPEKEENPKEEKKSGLSPAAEAFDWVKSFLFSLTVVIFVFTLFLRGVTVDGGSMLPTLENKDYLMISDLFYTPKTGDIVVVRSPHYKNATEPLIKRVIATGGQTVKINFQTWEVWVDGEKLEEDYILREASTSMQTEDMECDENGIAEIRVDQNCIFVMGDHRNDSLDSRSNSVGQIDERYIMGRVLIRLAPINRFGKVD